jgi:uncharacterized repeat protein (TIGR03803 family)
MRILSLGRDALVISLAMAISAGCGGTHALPLAASSQGTNGLPAHRLSDSSDKILYRFKGGVDGEGWYSALLNIGGTFYGTTPFGGTGNSGTVFALSSRGKKRTLHSFNGPGDGLYPEARLVVLNGMLYGTTSAGGLNGTGTVFALKPSGTEHVVYSFEGRSSGDGASPYSGLTLLNGALYGTTEGGGANNLGTVFKVTKSGNERVLYSFKGGNDGECPVAGLIADHNTLYGTTTGPLFCSGEGWGTVFSVSTSGKERVLYSFKGPPDGGYPYASLVNLNGTLYGTTIQGGTSGWGTVFAVSSSSGKERILHSFKGGAGDGQSSYAPLLDVNGTLYGTTQDGGGDYQCASGCGVVFDISASGSEHVLYSFRDDPDGGNPLAGLIDVNGALFGTTQYGGYGYGTVFRVSP